MNLGIPRLMRSRWSDSNRRPAVYKTAALPLSYIGLKTVTLYHRQSIFPGFPILLLYWKFNGLRVAGFRL
jgi:hypothetical protein